MNSTTKWALTTALAGFLFGFDTVVISGANQPIKELWDTTPVFHGFFIMSMALWGTVIGSLFGGIPADRFGRKVSLIWIGVLFTISAIGSGLAPDPYSFSFFRFITGQNFCQVRLPVLGGRGGVAHLFFFHLFV